MAGAGYKLFSTGDVLSASDVNLYLQQQTVMVFASAAARTTALASVLAEGMVSYLKDTDVVEIYTGAAWVSLDDPNAIQNSIVDAKGDIISATADNTPARLAVGANNTVLTADSSTATGLKWATASSGGMTLISTTTLTGASISLSSISSSYNNLFIVVQGFKPATDGANLYLRVNGDSTANRHFHSVSNDVYLGEAFSTTSINCSNGQDNGTGNSLIAITIFDYANSSTWKLINSSALTNNATTSTSLNYRFGFGAYNQTGAITSLDIFPSSGNFTSGTLLLYGVK